MVIVLMGVSGSGKSTVGRILADRLGWHFVEGDEFHSLANVAKMKAGTPLTDDDREPWLAAIRERMDQALEKGENVVMAGSALKHAYQDYLELHDPSHIHYVYLDGPEDLIRRRLAERKGHFMNPDLLHSQFEVLEAPKDAIRVDIPEAPEGIAEKVRLQLGL